MDSILNEISSIAKELQTTGEIDIDYYKMGVLFPFMEYLGYDTTTPGDVVTVPLYAPDGSYKVDYGLRGLKDDSLKTVIKLVPFGSNHTDEESKIRTCIIQNSSIEYVLITDCINYSIYAYDSERNSLLRIGNFNIINDETISSHYIDILKNPCLDKNKQEFAEYDDELEYEGPRGMREFSEDDYFKEDNDYENSEDKKKNKIKWGLVILSQLILLVLIVFLVLALKDPDSQVLNFLNFGNQNELDYYDISSTLDVELNKANHAIDIAFYSKDIPQGGVVRFDIMNGDDSAVLYGEVTASGKIRGSYVVPETWKYPSITVTAYLKFDELNHPQPANVRSKFGEIGEKIIGKEGAPNKFALSYLTIDYDSKAVQDYLLWLKEQEEANLRAERLADFANFEVRYDSLGNIKVLPSGYDMNSNNITGNVHVYPQIFYDAGTGFAHFYLVCGHISSISWSMFRSVEFYADGMSWNYDLGNNEKKQQVTGQYITEWVYLDNYNISSLPSEAAILGTSEVAQVVFNGAKAANYQLSKQEKNNIAAALALFNKYFMDYNNPPSIDWFKETTSSNTGVTNNSQINENDYSLAYIYSPSELLERDSVDQKKLNELEDNIAKANQNGEASPTQLATYEIDSHKYRVLSDDFKNALFNEFKDVHAMLVYEQDYESSNMNYYKLFFEYENPKSIESGYIPYIYVMENKTVYVPVKTSTGATISEKSYASFILSQGTFDKLLNEVRNTNYEQVD